MNKLEITDGRPYKKFSQNFLKDQNISRKICNSLTLSENSIILEIGPGPGALTKILVEKGVPVFAVEVDPRFADALASTLKFPDNLTVIESDFLKWDFEAFLESVKNKKVHVIGNLPYHITSPILFRILENAGSIEQAVFMVQKEVAQRIAAGHGSKTYGILSVFCQWYAQVKYLFNVPAHLFMPKPKVDSAVFSLNFNPEHRDELINFPIFQKIVRHTFNQRRKMLRNTLAKLFPQVILNQLDMNLTLRPEQLSVSDFVNLSNQIYRAKEGGVDE